jgi:hypothetical protein
VRSAVAAHVAATAIALAGCGEAAPPVQTANVARPPDAPARPFPEAVAAWGGYHSSRFHFTVPLPSPRAWKVDDTTHVALVATEASTRSKLTVFGEDEPELVNRQKCETRAEELGLGPARGMRTIEDVVTVGPEAYDTRVQVGVESAPGIGGSDREGGQLTGHVFAFGAYLKRCLIVHLATEVRSDVDEEILSQRLALARLRLVAEIKQDPLEHVAREAVSRRLP